MTTALFTHKDCLLHVNSVANCESPERLEAILAELKKPAYAALMRLDAPLATVDQIALVHPRNYIERILASVPAEGFVMLDPDENIAEDMALSPGSGKAALRAAGALVAATDAVLTGKTDNAFCAVRPPGHHASGATPAGFCIFNNIAIGAAHAIKEHSLKRIAIVDFDVHHGNGTQDWAEDRPEILFCSSHQMPLYPGSGRAQDGGPLGNIINIPLPPGTESAEFRRLVSEKILPAADAFAPELIMISAGFDAHSNDPLADLRLTDDDFFWITSEVCRLARKYCQGRVVSTLEGGYNLAALASSAGEHVRALLSG